MILLALIGQFNGIAFFLFLELITTYHALAEPITVVTDISQQKHHGIKNNLGSSVMT